VFVVGECLLCLSAHACIYAWVRVGAMICIWTRGTKIFTKF